MAKIAYIKYNLNISGLYGWGKGWLDPSYPSRWRSMCDELLSRGPSAFRESALKYGTSGACDIFSNTRFHAYMHPMDIAGHIMSCDLCPGDNERVSGVLVSQMTELAAFIRNWFPELELSMLLRQRRYDFDTDKETVPIDNTVL